MYISGLLFHANKVITKFERERERGFIEIRIIISSPVKYYSNVNHINAILRVSHWKISEFLGRVLKKKKVLENLDNLDVPT